MARRLAVVAVLAAALALASGCAARSRPYAAVSIGLGGILVEGAVVGYALNIAWLETGDYNLWVFTRFWDVDAGVHSYRVELFAPGGALVASEQREWQQPRAKDGYLGTVVLSVRLDAPGVYALRVSLDGRAITPKLSLRVVEAGP